MQYKEQCNAMQAMRELRLQEAFGLHLTFGCFFFGLNCNFIKESRIVRSKMGLER